MIVDSTNVAALYANEKTQSVSSSNLTEDRSQSVPRAEQVQTSDSGPAVVSDISSAALETSRAVSENSQTANQNPTADSEQEMTQPIPEQNRQSMGAESRQQSVDMVV